MPTIAIFAIAAIALTLTAPSKKAKPQPTNAPPLRDDPKDLLARALDAYIKDQEQKKPLL